MDAALLVGIVLALVDRFNMAPRANMAPLIIGFVVFAIGMSFGANSGYAINPARDLGPRLFAWIQGWGEIAVPGDYGNVNSYMWVPIVGPLVGALVYNFFIHNVLLARAPAPPPRARTGGGATPAGLRGPGIRGVTRRRPVRAVTGRARGRSSSRTRRGRPRVA